MYDAFISYSHAHDKPIADHVQHVLQTLGKPWYQRRAARVFRDDTSLTATPELWPTIVSALEASQHLILFASADAGSSQWVDKEVEWWLENKSTDRLLIVLTDGDLLWDEASGDFAQTAAMPLPPAMKGCFNSEPLWIDLRDWRQQAKPARNDVTFKSLVSKLAARIRDIPPEDLWSEELRQQRRNLMLASSAAVMLAIASVTAAWQAYSALIQRDATLKSQSRLLADEAARQLRNGDHITGLLLALEASPGGGAIEDRPYVAEAEAVLYRASSPERSSVRLDMGGASAAVWSLAVDQKTGIALAGLANGQLLFWSLENNKLIASIKPHSKRVWQVVLSPDGRKFASASSDGTLSLGTLDKVQNFRTGNHSGPVLDVQFSPDGRHIVSSSGGGDLTAAIWDSQSGERLHVLNGHHARIRKVRYSPSGRTIATASDDGTVRLWDSETGSLSRQLSSNGSKYLSLSFAPDGQRIAAGAANGTVTVWGVSGDTSHMHFAGHTGAVLDLGFSRDGSRILSASSDGTARIWGLSTQKEKQRFSGHAGGVVQATYFDADRKVVTASRDGTSRIWDPETGRQIEILGGQKAAMSRVVPLIVADTIITASLDGSIRLRKRTDRVPFQNMKRDLTHLFIGQKGDAEVLITLNARNVLSTHSMQNGTSGHVPLPIDGFIKKASYVQSQSSIVAIDESKNLTVQRLFADAAPQRFPLPFENLDDMAIGGNGRTVIVRSENRFLAFDLQEEQVTATTDLDGMDVSSFAVHPSSRSVAIGTRTGEIVIWDYERNAKEVVYRQEQGIDHVSFSPRGAFLALSTANHIALLDGETAKRILVEENKEKGPAINFQFSADEAFFAINFNNGVVSHRRTNETSKATDITVSSPVIQMAFLPGGQRALMLTINGMLQMWDLAAGSLVASIEPSLGRFSAFQLDAANGRTFALTEQGTLGAWRIFDHVDQLVQDAIKLAPRCFSPEERIRYRLSSDRPRWCERFDKKRHRIGG